ncbi:hypothetical protein ACIBEJ_10025 [Nonomuraea sp. NPDC050790]|uniref:hypothetical protein n=1 Tax=Nonomuraea sp. NPDC050790 TaxID=3364371 RepID=UPI0037A26856
MATLARLGCLAALVMVVPVLGATGATARTDPETTDRRWVICLDEDESKRLLDTADILGLGTPQPSPSGSATPTVTRLVVSASPSPTALTLREWRDRRKADFERACKALIGSDPDQRPPPESNPLVPTLLGLIPFFLGALVAFVSSEWRVAADASYKAAKELQRLSFAFEIDRKKYLQQLVAEETEPRDDDPCIDQLVEQVSYVSVLRPKWSEPAVIMRLLAAIKEDDRPDEWTGRINDNRAVAHKGVALAALDSVQDRIEGLIWALHHPWRPHRPMRVATQQSEGYKAKSRRGKG